MPFGPGILLLTWIMCFDELSALLVVQLSLCSDLHSWLNVIYYVNNLKNFLLMECIEGPDYLYIQLKNNKANLPVEWIVGKLHFLYISLCLLQHCATASGLFMARWLLPGQGDEWELQVRLESEYSTLACGWTGTLQGQHSQKGVEFVACRWFTQVVFLHRRHIRC